MKQRFEHLCIWIRGTAALVMGITACASTMAQTTTVVDPWVRATVSAQKATGLFATLTSAQGGKLVSASSPVAGVVEIHEMLMDGNTMKMRSVGAVELPAGKAVELKPGGYHVMMMGLKQVIKEGDTVPVTLVVEGKDGKRETLEVKASARALGAGQGKPMAGHAHQH